MPNPLQSGLWEGKFYNTYLFSLNLQLNIAVVGTSFTGTLRLYSSHPLEDYSVAVNGTISGNQITINQAPPVTTYFQGFYQDTPGSVSGASQSMFGTLPFSLSPDSNLTGGAGWILWKI